MEKNTQIFKAGSCRIYAYRAVRDKECVRSPLVKDTASRMTDIA